MQYSPSNLVVIMAFFLCSATASAQVDSTLFPIDQKGSSPVGMHDFTWGCIANFKLSDPSNWGRIQFVKASKNNRLYVVDNNGFIYCIDAFTFKEYWKKKLRSQYISHLLVSTSGQHIVVAYQYARSFTKTLDIIDGDSGDIIRQIRRYPTCYEPGYLYDMIENTSLYPGELVLSPDGNRLAVWFHNHGFNTLNCLADEIYELCIFDVQTGTLISQSKQIKQYIDGITCNEQFLFAFDKKGTSLWLTDCAGKIIEIDIKTMKIIRERSFTEDIKRLIHELDIPISRESYPFSSLAVQDDNTIMTSVHIRSKGIIFKIDATLKNFSHVTLNQDMDQGHILYSPNTAFVMMNANRMNIWELSSRKPILYDDVPKAIDGNTVCFHPSKEAIVVGTDRTLKVLAKCHKSTLTIQSNQLTGTGHYIAPSTTFSVRGKGRLNWAYEDVRIYKKYSQKNELSTDNLGKSRLFNKKGNLMAGTELYIQSNLDGVFEIFGGFDQSMTPQEAIQQIPIWSN